jgi:tetratricopeptide (TPR) repeat protein
MRTPLDCARPTCLTWTRQVLAENLPRIVAAGSHGIPELDRFRTQHEHGLLEEKHYADFMERNRVALGAHIPFVRWGAGLSVGNRVHTALHSESKIVPEKEIETAYTRMTRLVCNVGNKVNPGDPPLDKMNLAFFEYLHIDANSILTGVNETLLLSLAFKNSTYNCYTSSLALLAVGDEFNWSLFMVDVPRHFFVRYVDTHYSFNYDQGYCCQDSDYVRDYHIPEVVIKRGVYLQGMDRDSSIGCIFYNNGTFSYLRNDYATAISGYDLAIRINPNYADAYRNRIIAKMANGDTIGAMEDFEIHEQLME